MESVISTREEVERFLFTQDHCLDKDIDDEYIDVDGYCSGSGSGISCGFGYASGFGSGDVDLTCFGYSFAHGYGCGAGHSDGSGDGYDFDGGFGNGSDEGDVKSINGNIVDYIDDVPTIITQVRGNIACGYIVKCDLTLEFCYIAKVGDSFAHRKTLRDAVADAKAKGTERLPIEERIKKFKDVFGSLDSEHTGKEFYIWHNILTGSCRMGRDEFCKSNNIDLEKMYSVRYFLDITENAYGDEIIKLKENYLCQ